MTDAAVLATLLASMQQVRDAIGDARSQLSPLPADLRDYQAMDAPRRIAAIALLKSVEQLEDLSARTLRAALTYEQVDIGGLLPRAIADQAEKAGMIPSSDGWSDLVRLRNRLVHEYPLPSQQQWERLIETWRAADALIAISLGLVAYLQNLDIEVRP